MDEVKAIQELVLVPGTKVDTHRDMYVFACYTGVIRISDILQLKWKHFNGEHIAFDMQKTGNPLSVKVPNVGLSILAKYKHSDSGNETLFFQS